MAKERCTKHGVFFHHETPGCLDFQCNLSMVRPKMPERFRPGEERLWMQWQHLKGGRCRQKFDGLCYFGSFWVEFPRPKLVPMQHVEITDVAQLHHNTAKKVEQKRGGVRQS